VTNGPEAVAAAEFVPKASAADGLIGALAPLCEAPPCRPLDTRTGRHALRRRP